MLNSYPKYKDDNFSDKDSVFELQIPIVITVKVKFTRPQLEVLRGAHLLFYSHEPYGYKMIDEYWLDT